MLKKRTFIFSGHILFFSTIFNIKVQNKSCIFPIEISVKTLYFIITASFRLKMGRNAGNGCNCAR